MCFDIYNPRDSSVPRLHKLSNVSKLDIRRHTQLLNIMFNLRQSAYFRTEGPRITRAANNYVFHTDIIHAWIYAISPYYEGAKLWNGLPAGARMRWYIRKY